MYECICGWVGYEYDMDKDYEEITVCDHMEMRPYSICPVCSSDYFEDYNEEGDNQ